MAYKKQTWVTGETITAEKLNHMEEGIEASSSDEFIPIFTIRYEISGKTTAKCDKTYEEVLAAIIANKCFRGKVIFDGIPEERYWYLSGRYSQDDNDFFIFEQSLPNISNETVTAITHYMLTYNSDGTIEYEHASRNFE